MRPAPLTATPATTGRKSARPATITTLTALLVLWAAVLSVLWPLAITAPRAPANLTSSARSPGRPPLSQPATNGPADTWT